MPRIRILKTRFILILIALACAGATTAHAGEPPEKFQPSTKTKLNLLFPSVSEIYTAAEARGLSPRTSASQLDLKVPEWPKLTDQQKHLQLGSLIGYLAIIATGNETALLIQCLEGILGGLSAAGIPETSNSQKAIREALGKIQDGTISKVRLYAILDDLRREGLRDATAILDDTSVATILAGAWLRGGILLADQINSNEDAAKLAEIFARPELLDFMGILSSNPENEEIVGSLVKLANKRELFNKSDLDLFAGQAKKLLG